MRALLGFEAGLIISRLGMMLGIQTVPMLANEEYTTIWGH